MLPVFKTGGQKNPTVNRASKGIHGYHCLMSVFDHVNENFTNALKQNKLRFVPEKWHLFLRSVLIQFHFLLSYVMFGVLLMVRCKKSR